jgi:bacterioferritin-associated ferredoxin
MGSFDPSEPIHRCVCHDIEFADLKRLADSLNLDIQGLKQAANCSTSCGMCEPYIRLMLATGKVKFPILRPTAIESLIERAEQDRARADATASNCDGSGI